MCYTKFIGTAYVIKGHSGKREGQIDTLQPRLTTDTHTSLTEFNGRYYKTSATSSGWSISQGIKLPWLFSKSVDNTLPGETESDAR